MGNGQNKEPKEASPQSAEKPRFSLAFPTSPTAGSAARLERGFKVHASVDGNEKTTLSKQDFTDVVFLAIPLVGKRIYRYFVSLQPGEQPKIAVDKTMYTRGGTKIMGLLSDDDQVKFYIHLFTKGKDLVTIPDLVDLLSVSEQTAWLSAGITLRPTPESKQFFEKNMKTLFKDGNAVSSSDIVSWSNRMCPKMTANLHSYVICCLMDNKTPFLGKDDIPAGVVKQCKDGQSLLNLSSVWLLTCVLPSKYFPISAASGVLPPSNIANVVQNNAWHSIYDSNNQGLSVNRFQHHVMNYLGPTILILSFDKFVYAVAVDLPWTESKQRWGGVDGMFLQIHPDYRLVQSGEGLIYLNLSDRTAPKGLHVGKDSRTTFLKVNDELSHVNHYSVDYKLTTIEVWGCGGQETLSKQHQQYQWEHKEVTKNQNRKLVPDDWRDNPDKALLEMGGVSTEHNERTDI